MGDSPANSADRSEFAETLKSWASAPTVPPDADGRSSSARTPLRPYYAAADARSEVPGEYPYTRGLDPRGYRDGFWVMGQYSGYGTPAATKERLRRLLEQGQTGLSFALDLPTQMGIDSDDERADGEVGKVGVPLDTVEDLVVLLDGLPLDDVKQIRTTANSIGPIFAAFLIVAFERLSLSTADVRLLLQNDVLKEYSARGTYIFPPEAGLRLSVDVIEYFARELPHWEPIEFCGYHLRDAGGSLIHEIGIATVNGLAYLDDAQSRGLSINDFAHSLYLFLSAGMDIFEEAAKFRAARRIWARILSDRYDVRPEAAGLKIFAYTLGGALTAQEPLANTVRVSYEALGAILGGAQTMATSSYDEALGLPSPDAARLALQTQQILAHESGATAVADPLGGSWYVEELTDRIESATYEYVARIVESGGAVQAIASGLIASDLADAAYRFQQEVDSGERVIVGVNMHRSDVPSVRAAFQIDGSLQREHCAALAERKGQRDAGALETVLAAVTRAARAGENSLPTLIAAARADATIGEIVEALASVHGRFHSRATYFGTSPPYDL